MHLGWALQGRLGMRWRRPLRGAGAIALVAPRGAGPPLVVVIVIPYPHPLRPACTRRHPRPPAEAHLPLTTLFTLPPTNRSASLCDLKVTMTLPVNRSYCSTVKLEGWLLVFWTTSTPPAFGLRTWCCGLALSSPHRQQERPRHRYRLHAAHDTIKLLCAIKSYQQHCLSRDAA